MRKPRRENIKEAVRFTLEKYDVRDVTPSAVRRILGALGYETVRLGTAAENEKLTGLGFTPSDLTNDLLVVRRNEGRYVFIAADAENSRMLPLLAKALGYIVLCDADNGVYGKSEDDTATADEFSHILVGITKHGTLYNICSFHPSAVIGTVVMVAAAVFLGFVLFGGQTALPTDAIGETAERVMPVSAQFDGAPTVSQEPLQISSDAGAAKQLDELAGAADMPAAQPSDGFIPLSPDAALPGYDSTVMTSGTADTPTADTVISRAVPVQEAPQAVPAAQTADEVPTVSAPSGYYATSAGKKYHMAGCSYLNGKAPVSVSAEDIASGKYTPCSKCIK